MEALYPFQDQSQEQLFHKVSKELRCTVCQNQSLSDSNAPLAVSLRQEVYRQVKAGHSEPEILSFMVEHYGESILYNPPFQAGTSLLWLGPICLLVLGMGILFKNLRTAS